VELWAKCAKRSVRISDSFSSVLGDIDFSDLLPYGRVLKQDNLFTWCLLIFYPKLGISKIFESDFD
jgi:hypothetical protein